MIQVRLNSSFMMRVLIIGGSMLLVFAFMLAFAKSVSAFGYVDSPASRSIQCKNGLNTNCGPIIYEPQSLEGLKGFPASGPADGQIASAGNAIFSNLDQQSATRWNKASIASGQNIFTWKIIANHATTSYRYFITKTNWDPNQPLTRAQLDLTPFCTVPGNNPPSVNVSHSCNVPPRTGYHIILAVRDIANTPNAFYNVIDVNIGAGDITPPTAPTNFYAGAVGVNSAYVNWGASIDANGVAGYEVYANGNPTPIASTTGATSVSLPNLQSGTTYTLTVKAYDSAGNRSAASNSIQITPGDNTAPTSPTGLQVVGTAGSNSVTLKWNASTDANGIAGYRIYTGGNVVANVPGTATQWNVSGLSSNTSYTFTVRAVDPSTNESGNSNAVTVTTGQGTTAAPWAPNTVYALNTLVSYNGLTYKCTFAHTSLVGWQPGAAAALWQLQP
ncbi:lytic polysaccharide monooxygenase [Paenibacillus sp. GCM10027627]|uniref:lytic polysaccharide monooxygenase n=1 Tax=unclassified Paenibacillus TaxID=185978 RepID=UPI00363FF579